MSVALPEQRSAVAHNQVVSAAMLRAIEIEDKLVELLTPILDKAGRDAAKLFAQKATPLTASVEIDVLLLAAAPADEASTRARSLVAATRELASAEIVATIYEDVDNARRELQHVATSDDPKLIALAEKKLKRAQDRLKRTLQSVEQPPQQPPPEPTPTTPTLQPGQGVTLGTEQPIAPTPSGGISPADVAKEVARVRGEEARIEEQSASELEQLLEGKPGEGLKALKEIVSQPFGGGPDWVQPLADEICNVVSLIQQLRGKTDPVRAAVAENAMRETVEGAGINFDLTNPFAQKVLAQSGSQVTNIAETTQLNIMRIVGKAYEEGLSIPDTAKAIQQGMKAATPARARLIARTELAAAVNGGSLAGAQIVQSVTQETMYKQWLTAPGAKYPRHEDYEGLDQQTVKLDEYFDVGGFSLQFPGDPDGPPEEVCNCRCTLVYVDTPEEGVNTTPGAPAAPHEQEGYQAQIGITPFRATEIAGGLPDVPNEWKAGEEGLARFVGPGADDPSPSVLDGMLRGLPDDQPQDFGLGLTVTKRAPFGIAPGAGPSYVLRARNDMGHMSDRIILGTTQAADYIRDEVIGVENAGRGAAFTGPLQEGLSLTDTAAVQYVTSLSAVERKAITDLTEPSTAAQINRKFREDLPLSPWEQMETERVDRVLANAPFVKEGTTLYRGINLSDEQARALIKKTKEDFVSNLSGGGFQSASIDPAEALLHTPRDEQDRPVIFRINGPTRALPNKSFSLYPKENEYLIPRDQEFAVKHIGLDMIDGAPAHVIDVEAVPKLKIGDINGPEFYATPKYEQFVNDVRKAADHYGVQINKFDRVTGLWQGDTEPAVAIIAHDGEEGVRAMAADLGRAYDQDGVLLFDAVTPPPAKLTFSTYVVEYNDDVYREVSRLDETWPIDDANLAGDALYNAENGYGDLSLARDAVTGKIVAVANVDAGGHTYSIKALAAPTITAKDALVRQIAGDAASEGKGLSVPTSTAKEVVYWKAHGFVEAPHQVGGEFVMELGVLETKQLAEAVPAFGEAVDVAVTFDAVPLEERSRLLAALDFQGIDGGTFLPDGRLQVIGNGSAFVGKAQRVAGLMGVDYDASIGRMQILEKKDYGKVIQTYDDKHHAIESPLIADPSDSLPGDDTIDIEQDPYGDFSPGVSPLGGGHVNSVFLVERNGEKYVVKPDPGFQTMREDIEPGNDLGRERAAYVMSKYFADTDPKFAVDTPPLRISEITGESGDVQDAAISEFVPNAISWHSVLGGAQDKFVRSDAFRNGALFDAVIGNTDRHGGNFLISPDDKVHLIDHGLAFADKDLGSEWGYHNALLLNKQLNSKPRLTDQEVGFLEKLRARWPQLQKDLGQLLSKGSMDTMKQRIDYMIEHKSLAFNDYLRDYYGG